MNFKNKRIAVTGAAGFKGQYICEFLRQMGAEVEGYDDDDGFMPIQHLYHVGYDAYVHFAATTIVSECQQHPEDAIKNNIEALLYVLKNVRECDPGKPVLVATTDKVYKYPNNENNERYHLGGSCPYSESKVAVENICELYRKFYGMKIITVRCANVIGQHDKNLTRLVPDIITKLKAGEKAVIRNPAFTRPYIYVLDAIWSYLQILDRMLNDEITLDSINIGTKHYSCLEIGTMLELVSNQDIEYGAPQDFKESANLHLDFTYALNVLQLYPIYSIPNAIRETWHKWDIPVPELVKDYISRRKDELA